jgi:hypothetical protein
MRFWKDFWRAGGPRRRVLLVASAGALVALGGTLLVALSQVASQPGRERVAALHLAPTARPTARATATPSGPAAAQDPTGPGHIYHVSRAGNNGDGLSWQTAWNELANINWSVVQPGDTILLDGGPSGMTYTTSLEIDKSGTVTAPIHIQRSVAAGHDGTVTIFGGRSEPLPFCGESQSDYRLPTSPVLNAGIYVTASWVVVDGMSWHGIVLHGAGWNGGINMTQMDASAGNDTFRHIEIYDNGTIDNLPGNTLQPDSAGVYPKGTNLTFEYMDIHDNGQDNFQSSGTIRGMTVRYSWMHYTRSYPGHPSTSYNLCTHNDGMQIYGYGQSSAIDFEDDIIGPGISNGYINNASVGYTINATFRNVLILDPGSHGIFPDSDSAANWTIDHVTVFSQAGDLELAGTHHTVTNSIFYAGHVQVHNYDPGGPLDGVNSVSTASNNCEWHTDYDPSGINARMADPQFNTNLSSYPVQARDSGNPNLNGTDQYPTLGFFLTADFSLARGSPCAGMGSEVTSVSQFLRIVTS